MNNKTPNISTAKRNINETILPGNRPLIKRESIISIKTPFSTYSNNTIAVFHNITVLLNLISTKEGDVMHKKAFLKLLLFLAVPPMISYLIYLLWGFNILLVTAIFYFLLLLFSIPAGEDALSTLSDYEVKRDNPFFKDEKKVTQKKANLFKLIAFLILAIGYMLVYIETLS